MRMLRPPIIAPCLLVCPLAAETLAGAPCLFTFDTTRSFLARTSSGALIPAPGLLPAHLLQGLPPATGTPVAASAQVRAAGGSTLEQHLTFRGKGGVLHDISLHGRGPGGDPAGEWRVQPLNAKGSGAEAAQGNPSTLFHEGRFRVVYTDVDGGLIDLTPGAADGVRQLNRGGLTEAPPAAHDPVQLEVAGNRMVFYADADGVIWRIRERDDRFRFCRITNGGCTQAPAAQGPLTAFCTARELVLVYAGPAGQIIAITQDLDSDAWAFRQLNDGAEGGSEAPLAPTGAQASALACLPLPAPETGYRVVYRTADGKLIQLRSRGPQFEARHLNAGALPKAASGPALLAGPGGQGCSVSYLDEDGNITLLTGDDKAWVAECLFSQRDLPARNPGETHAQPSRPTPPAPAPAPAPGAAAAPPVPAPAPGAAAAPPAPAPAPAAVPPPGTVQVGGWVGKQISDAQSRLDQGRWVGRDVTDFLKKIRF